MILNFSLTKKGGAIIILLFNTCPNLDP